MAPLMAPTGPFVNRTTEPVGVAPRIAVFRALKLGDMLCAVPALRALRRRFPRAHVTLIGLPWAASFARRYGRYIDDFVAFPGYPGLPEQPVGGQAARRRFFNSLQARRYDWAIQMHGSGRVSNGVVALFGSRHTVGYSDGDPAGLSRALDYREAEHEVLRNLRLVAALGAPPGDTALEFPLHAEDAQAFARVAGLTRLVEAPYVCIHPGASTPEGRWPAARFAAVADALAARGLHVVLTGRRDEVAVTADVAAAMASPASDVAGDDLDLGPLALLLKRARLLVSNDTGVSHLAAALRVPSVAVFSKADPARWAPLDGDRHRALAGGASVSAERVAEAAQRALDRTEPCSRS